MFTVPPTHAGRGFRRVGSGRPSLFCARRLASGALLLRPPGLNSALTPTCAVRPQARHLTSLCLSGLVCNMSTIIVPP